MTPPRLSVTLLNIEDLLRVAEAFDVPRLRKICVDYVKHTKEMTTIDKYRLANEFPDLRFAQVILPSRDFLSTWRIWLSSEQKRLSSKWNRSFVQVVEEEQMLENVAAVVSVVRDEPLQEELFEGGASRALFRVLVKNLGAGVLKVRFSV